MKKKLLLTSILSIVMCVSLIAGATFALFTSESKVNVAVTSGKVDVVATIEEDYVLYSPRAIGADGTITDPTNVATETFANGGTVELDGNRLTVRNIAPGDRVEFVIVIKNYSTVSVKYRTEVNKSGDAELLNALNISVGETSNWTRLDATDGEHGETVKTVNCFVELPGTAEAEAEGKSCELFFTVNAVQGNADVPDVIVAPATQEAFSEALSSLENGKSIQLDMPSGTYTLPVVTNKKVTVSGTEATVIDMKNSSTIGAQNAGLDITFDGVTVEFDNSFDYKGITHSDSVVYENCVIKGNQVMFANDVKFIGCTFENNSDYCVWTYGAGEVLFENCTFKTAGKAILVYAEQGVDSQTVNVKDCVFKASAKGYTYSGDNCAAIEIDGSLITGTYTVNISGTNYVENNFADISRIKNQKDPANVTVNDGSEVISADLFAFVSEKSELATALDIDNISRVAPTILLTNDIDMSGWTALNGGGNHPGFTINGNGYALKNQSTPLFKEFPAHPVTVKNVNFVNANIDVSGAAGAGVLFGIANSNGGFNLVVEECNIVNSTIKSEQWSGGFIGFVGQNTDDCKLVFTNCSVTGSTISGNDGTGGLIGSNYSKVEIKDVTVSGNIFNGGEGYSSAALVGSSISAASVIEAERVTVSGNIYNIGSTYASDYRYVENYGYIFNSGTYKIDGSAIAQ